MGCFWVLLVVFDGSFRWFCGGHGFATVGHGLFLVVGLGLVSKFWWFYFSGCIGFELVAKAWVLMVAICDLGGWFGGSIVVVIRWWLVMVERETKRKVWKRERRVVYIILLGCM